MDESFLSSVQDGVEMIISFLFFSFFLVCVCVVGGVYSHKPCYLLLSALSKREKKLCMCVAVVCVELLLLSYIPDLIPCGKRILEDLLNNISA